MGVWEAERGEQGPGGSLGRWEVSAVKDAEGGGIEKGERIKLELEGTREVEEGKGEEEEEEGERGEWDVAGRDVAHRQASRRGEAKAPAPREVIKGRSGWLMPKVPARLGAAPLGPGRAPLHGAPRTLSPKAEGAERERDRCQPCPGELGAAGAKDGAQPASCPPPPPPAGKML